MILDKHSILIVLLLFLLLPALSISPEYRISALVATGIFYAFVIYDELITLKGFDRLFLLTLVFLIYSNLVGSVLRENYITQFVQLSIFLLCIHISWYILIRRPNNLSILIISILSLNLITLVLTYIELGQTPEVARLLSNSNEISNEIISRGIGGYGLVYSNVLMFPVLVIGLKSWFTKQTRLKFVWITRILLLLNMVTISLLIMKAGYTIAVLLLIIQAVFLLLFRRASPRFYLTGMIIMGIVVTLFMLMQEYQEEIKGLVEGTFYEQKVNDILATLHNESSEGSVGGRTERYVFSLEAFVKSPLFGKLIPNNAFIGGHSTILDTFGRFGLFLGVLLIVILTYVPVKLYKASGSYQSELLMFIFSLFVILVFNRESMTFGVPYILLASIYCLEKKKNEEESTVFK